ncbi:rRNA pseudouridine synthase [Candidatus Saccharibacteria bacterium]|nr:MAG: rRNA pseudouridine synthase [Candidatus Saccharibacteria bacterium]
MRLNKYLAHATGISRREADELIEQGRVLVNGKPAELGQPVAETDILAIDGKLVGNTSPNYTYLILNKPVGYVCSRKRQGESPTIYELLPEQYRTLKPVGRLDRDSSGLLLLTDDGDFAHRMTHPSFHKNKTYEVTLDKPLEPLHQQMISDYGVTLEDGVSKFLVTKIRNSKFEIQMSEGRNRQIRRTFAALGYTVTRLHRTTFGTFRLEELEEGDHKTIATAAIT